MKTIIGYISLLLLIAMGCQKEPMQKIHNEPMAFRIKYQIENPQIIITKNNKSTLSNLYVLVFDENGYFITRKKAVVTDNELIVNLEQSNKPRILHFIGNYEWINFSDSENHQMHENELLLSLSVNNQSTLWQRYEVNSINETELNFIVTLLRSYAQFSFVNSTSGNSTLKNEEYYLYNSSDRGTVSPFDRVTAKFKEGFVTPHPDKQYVLSNRVKTESIYTYERFGDDKNYPLYLIIKGDYNHNGTITTCYYKVELRNDDKPIDVVRNTHYIITINSIESAGHSNFYDAINNPPANELGIDIKMKEFNTVSNGSSMLSVDRTKIVVTEINKEISLNYYYTSEITSGTIDNNGVRISISHQTTTPAFNDSSLSFTTNPNGTITLKSNQFLPSIGEKFISEITITKNGLSRIITVILENPTTISNIVLNPSNLNNTIDQKISLSFNIPSKDGVKFPHPVYISTVLAPDIDTDKDNHLTISTENGEIKWRYMANSAGQHTLNFKTTTIDDTHTLTIESPQYASSSIDITNTSGLHKFETINIDRYGDKSGKVRIAFSIAYYNKPIDVHITTKSLTPDPEMSHIQSTSMIPDGSGYIFHLPRWGSHVLYFNVNGNSGETITLSADDFEKATLTVPRK